MTTYYVRTSGSDSHNTIQALIDVIPEMVSEADDGTLSTRDTHLIPVLVRAVQQLTARLESLEAH